MNRLAEIYRSSLWYLIVLFLFALLLIMGAQIILRYGFNASLIWAEEMCRYLLVWVTFLACALSYERGELAGVSMLRDALPRKIGLCLAILSNVIAVTLLAALVYYGFSYAARIGSQPIPAMRFLMSSLIGPTAPVPSMFWVYASLPVGLTMLAIRIGFDIGLYLKMFTSGESASSLRSSQSEVVQ